MRADRLLSIVLLLQARGRLSGRDLALKLEVSERTVHRDMDALSAAGVPVFALRGSRGGWQLDEDWRTQVPGLDESELRALLMAQPRVIGDKRLAAAAERALGKLMAALPAPLREKAASIRQRLYVDTTAWRGSTEDLAMLPIVQDAVARDRKLAFHYRRPRSEGEDRTVDPLGLVAKGSAWYLVAFTPRGFRTYRVSRMTRARVLELPSTRPADFDLAAYWKSSTETFQESLRRFEATLHIEASVAKRMETWWIASPVKLGEPPGAAGWTTLRVQFGSEDEACFIVLALGPRVIVIEPSSLRDRVLASAEAVIKQARTFHRTNRGTQ